MLFIRGEEVKLTLYHDIVVQHYVRCLKKKEATMFLSCLPYHYTDSKNSLPLYSLQQYNSLYTMTFVYHFIRAQTSL